MTTLAELGEIAKSQEKHREGRYISGAGGALMAGGAGSIGLGARSWKKQVHKIVHENNLHIPEGLRGDDAEDYIRSKVKGAPKRFKGQKRMIGGVLAAGTGIPVLATGAATGAANLYRNRKIKEQ